MATRKQVEANRRNGRRGGPKTAEGKAVSRMNALKHGIFQTSLTESDDPELATIHGELVDWQKPVGPIENMLVDKLAQTYLRLHRCARAEARWHRDSWTPTGYMRALAEVRGEECPEVVFNSGIFARSVEIFGRYDRTLTNQLIKILHELERVQRLRLGDDVKPPGAADMSLHVDGAASSLAWLEDDELAEVVTDAAARVHPPRSQIAESEGHDPFDDWDPSEPEDTS